MASVSFACPSESPKRMGSEMMPRSAQSMAKATAAPVEMVSSPRSSQSWLNLTMFEKSEFPVFEAARPIVSYSTLSASAPGNAPFLALTCWPQLTGQLKHPSRETRLSSTASCPISTEPSTLSASAPGNAPFLALTCWPQLTGQLKHPSRETRLSSTASCPISTEPSKEPEVQLRVGRMLTESVHSTITGVPASKSHDASESLACTFLENSLRSALASSETAGLFPPCTAIAFNLLEPMTAPEPPRPLKPDRPFLVCPTLFPMTDTPTRFSPAGPMADTLKSDRLG